MPKPEWGVKRTCPNCDERFYDLQKEPIVCPECGETYDVDAHGKVSVTRERRAPVKARVVDEDLVDDEDVVDDEEDEDEALLGDDEDDEEPASPTLSDEEDDVDEAVPFKEPGLIDEDEEEDDEDVDLDEDDDEVADDDDDLDDVPGKGNS